MGTERSRTELGRGGGRGRGAVSGRGSDTGPFLHDVSFLNGEPSSSLGKEKEQETNYPCLTRVVPGPAQSPHDTELLG